MRSNIQSRFLRLWPISAHAGPTTPLKSRPTGSPIRESMRLAGSLVQPLITAITGTPLIDERPFVVRTGLGRVAQGLLTFAIATGVSLAIGSGSLSPWLLPVAWLFTVNAARNFQTGVIHHASHDNLTRHPRIDRFLGEFVSTLVFIQPLALYAPDHKKHHGQLALEADPDLRLIVAMGFKPALTMRQHFIHLLRTAVSPSFHAMFLASRFRSNFVEAPLARRLAAATWAMVLLTTVALSGTWLAFIIGFAVPVFPLYHMSGMLQVLTEHNWVRVGTGKDPARIVLSKLTSARFMGCPSPNATGNMMVGIVVWIMWWTKLLIAHGSARLFVVGGDLPNHDWHHRIPRSAGSDPLEGWPNAAYARRDDVVRGNPNWPTYTEVWGVLNALRLTFSLLASLPPTAKLGDPMTYEEKRDAMPEM